MPAAGGSTPAEWLTWMGELVDAGSEAADFNGFLSVALRWRHEPDAAVGVLIVVPAHKCCHPAAGACPAQVKSGDRPAGCRAWRSQPVSITPAPVAAPAGHHYTCIEIGSYASAQQPLRQGHAYLDRDGDGVACELLKHCLSGAYSPLGTLLGP